MGHIIDLLTETITVKGIVDEDFVNYRVPSMTIMFPSCDFKCGEFCHNLPLINEPNITIPIRDIFRRYSANPITKAIVCQGLEPFDSWEELYSLLFQFKIHEACQDDFVIYTGYTKEEIADKIKLMQTMYSNVIIKFGRYIPDIGNRYDDILGVWLASNNQYGERIS